MSNVWYYVTGTDSGFGKEAVARLADKKCNVFAGHFMKESAAMLSALGTTVVPVALDVTSDASVKSAAEAIEKRLAESGGSLGGLVNNAGLLFQNGPSEWTPVANWQKMYDVNVLGMVRVTNSVLPLLRKAEGRIVNTASIAGRTGLPTQTAYCASKWAVEGYSEALRREVHVWGITVHIVEPGVFLQTDLYKTYYDGLDKLWAGCSSDVKAAYGEEYKKQMQAGIGGISKLNNNDPSEVPKAYIHALTAQAPQFRYRCGKDSKIDITVLTWLPDSWQDALLRSKTASHIPAASSVAAMNRAIARYAQTTVVRKLVLLVLLIVGTVYAKKRLA